MTLRAAAWRAASALRLSALVAALALIAPTVTWAEEYSQDSHFDAVLQLFDPSIYDCYYRPAGDLAPYPDIVVAPSSSVPDIATGIAAAANNPLADANLDGVISICVEPGTYTGPLSFVMSDFEAPLWVWSSQGPTATSISAPSYPSSFLHLVQVGRGLGTLPPLTSLWEDHLVLRGFTVAGGPTIQGGTVGGAGLRVHAGLRVKVGGSDFVGHHSVNDGGTVHVEGSDLRLYAVSIALSSSQAGGGGRSR